MQLLPLSVENYYLYGFLVVDADEALLLGWIGKYLHAAGINQSGNAARIEENFRTIGAYWRRFCLLTHTDVVQENGLSSGKTG